MKTINPNDIQDIINCLQDDFYYSQKTGSYSEIASYCRQVLNNYLLFTKQNPIVSSFGDKVYFEPDLRNVDRDGERESLIKYATHFVTSTDEKTGFRIFDLSKAQSLALIKYTIEKAELKFTIKNRAGEITINYIYSVTKNSNSVIVGIEDIDDKSYI